MKPKASNRLQTSVITAGSGRNEFEAISLDRAYEIMGFLITESRVPDKTLKGRRDGSHIFNDTTSHYCSDDNKECQKIKKYRETMVGLSRNDIPLCIEVLLCPECELKSHSGESNIGSRATHEVGAGHSQSYVLLEQWTIQRINVKSDGKAQGLQSLSNAVRSHLCFSQLSAWLQTSHGSSPRHIFYRLTAPGEWFVHKFVMSPQQHTFPDAVIGEGHLALRVALSTLPRTSMTPYEISVASRDQLFAKNSSPIIQRSNSTQQPTTKNLASTSYNTETGISLTPKERSHVRSKSVRGIQDLSDRKPSKEEDSNLKAKTETQRCLTYSDKSQIDDMKRNYVSAEKLATFTTLPTNHLNKLELISCLSGTTPHRDTPNKLAISPHRTKALKSPKVLFTRTSVFSQDNFFSVPSIDSLKSLDDQVGETSTENDSDCDSVGQGYSSNFETGKPTFNIGDDSSYLLRQSEKVLESSKFSLLSQNDLSNGSPHKPSVDREEETLSSEQSSREPSPDIKRADFKNVGVQDESRSKRSSKTVESNVQNISFTKKATPTRHHPAFSQFARSKLFKQLPSQSSPAPVKKAGKNNFGYDDSLNTVKAIKSAISCSSLIHCDENTNEKDKLSLSSSAPTISSSQKASVQTHSSLLGNFEESLLNGRIDPAGVVNGFTVDIGASGAFCPKHVTLPVIAYFFNSLSDDDAPSPYLGYVDLTQISRRGYQIPRKGTLQITLFYPNHKVNKMFVVTYDLSDMPSRSQTFIRQKTLYAPCESQSANSILAESKNLPTYLRYLIHLRFRSTKTDKIFLHTDIRLIYARDKFEFDARVASYELRSFTESPSNPKYSPLR